MQLLHAARRWRRLARRLRRQLLPRRLAASRLARRLLRATIGGEGAAVAAAWADAGPGARVNAGPTANAPDRSGSSGRSRI